MKRTWLQLMCCTLSIGSPCISRLGGVEWRQSLGGVDNIVRDLRSKLRGKRRRRSQSYKAEVEFLLRCQNFAKRSRESDQVADSIFELKIIHVGEVAYM